MNFRGKRIKHAGPGSSRQDVSSKSYDRWNYMPEKRAGMKKWDKFVAALLTKRPVTIAA